MISECEFVSLGRPETSLEKIDWELPSKARDESTVTNKALPQQHYSEAFITIANDSYLELRDCLLKSENPTEFLKMKPENCFALNLANQGTGLEESGYVGVLSL